MKKTLVLGMLSMIAFCATLVAEGIEGYWKTISDETGKAESVVVIYKYQGKYYGRLIGSYNEEGKMDDTIYDPKDRAPGIESEPYYSGMDIIWGLRPKDNRYKGKIVDPQEGKIYDAELWIKGDDLIVRGEVFIFGRNQVWPPATDADFPPGFKKPDVSKFVPIIPEVR